MTDARDLTIHLRGRWHGRYGCAPCPICQPEGHNGQSALTLADGDGGRLLLNCKKTGCDLRDILAATGLAPGDYTPPDPAALARRKAEADAQVAKRAAQAARLWNEAKSITGTPAETYLREARGITCPLPVNVRFHEVCWHGATATRHPAMVALVEGGRGFAVHRTYLRRDGMGKADIDPAKAMLGATAGGAVRLTEGQGPLVVAEGIETALALAGAPLLAGARVWAALSTSGVQTLRLPYEPGRVTIAPDGDDAGRKAANALAERATALGWHVSLLPAPQGQDWADVLSVSSVLSEGAA